MEDIMARTPAYLPSLETYDPMTVGDCPTGRDLDKRTTVLETHMVYIKEDLQDNKKSLENLTKSVSDISTSIDKQNGTLPRIEKALENVTKQQRKDEGQQMAMGTKQKILWGVMVTVAAIVGSVLVKALLGVLL